MRIRLSEIDTPERGQPCGSRAREHLAALAFGKLVRVEVRGTDRYQRTLSRVYEGAEDVNVASQLR